MKRIIVAYDRRNAIGLDNDLPWKRDLPADLKHFKELTLGTSIVMGRHTFESIGKPLPGRENIVITSSNLAVDGIKVVRNLEEAYQVATHETVSIIGGSRVYSEAINSVDEIRATEVGAEFPEATVFFPTLDSTKWQETSREHSQADEKNKYPFDFVTYRSR